MSNEKESNDRKPDVAETKKESKPKKELTPQEIQKRKKILVYPLLFLIFAGTMWLIFAPSDKDKDGQQPEGFNSELPVPKDEGIVNDKRQAYEQEAMSRKQEEKRRNLQDFAFSLGEDRKAQEEYGRGTAGDSVAGYQDNPDNGRSRSGGAISSSASAYQDVNRQLSSWHEQQETDEQVQPAMESRIQELERKLEEDEQAKNTEEKQLELIEKSYQMAAKYTPGIQGKTGDSAINTREKVIPEPVSQVQHRVVSLLAAPMENGEFMEQYGKPRNMGFITVSGNEAITDKNSIRACVYRTVTLATGKELQLRLQEPMRAGNILIPANTIMTGSAKIGGERLLISINSIQYAGNVMPVEMEVYDMDGVQGIFVPNSDELNAMKEIAANMGTSMGSSITITDDAGSQLAADLGRSAIQGVSQYVSKKMQEVKVTLKAGYKVLLLPKT